MQTPGSETNPDGGPTGGVSWPLLAVAGVVLVLFLVLGAMLLQPGRNVSAVPSALIGRQAPPTDLPAVEGLLRADGQDMPAFTSSVLEGRLTLVNVWASWCAPCREEHPFLMDLAADDGIQLVGLNYKDTPKNASRFLATLGNPFDAVGADNTGRTAINWGVYGVPENFLVGADGTIIWKHVGPLTPGVMQNDLLPLLAEHKGQQ
ncbi:MAG: DsbE family thiol:disulfide interchange protein [Pseudomonadota bacterium]